MKSYIALCVIHRVLMAGVAMDPIKKTGAKPPVIAKIAPGTVFEPLNITEEGELLAAKAMRLPRPGEDISDYPVFKNDKTEVPVEKTAEELAAEEKAKVDREAAAQRTRDAAKKKADDAKAAKDRADADAKAAKDKADADAKAAADKAAADKLAQENADLKAKEAADAAKKAADEAAAAAAAAAAANGGTAPEDDVV